MYTKRTPRIDSPEATYADSKAATLRGKYSVKYSAVAPSIVFEWMNERAEICRRKAAECERAALLATDETVRATYADLARQWLEMAEQADMLERIRRATRHI